MKNEYAKQQRNYPRNLTNMYGLMVAFDPERVTPVAGGCNDGLHFGNEVANSEGTWNGDHGGCGGTWRKLDCWHFGGGHLKSKCPNHAEEKEKTKNYDGGANDKRFDGKTEVNGGHLHTMFTSSADHASGTYFSNLVEDKKITWHQFHVKGWGTQYFEVHALVAMHNTTERAVPLTWLLLDSQSTV